MSCASGALVLQQGLQPDDRHAAAFQLEAGAFRDGFGEGGAADAVEHVDAPWGQADLQDAAVVGEVGFGDFEGMQGGAEGGQGAIDTLGVCRVRAHQHVQIFGRSRMAVVGNRVATHHDELGARVEQLDQQIAEVVEQLHQEGSGTKR